MKRWTLSDKCSYCRIKKMGKKMSAWLREGKVGFAWQVSTMTIKRNEVQRRLRKRWTLHDGCSHCRWKMKKKKNFSIIQWEKEKDRWRFFTMAIKRDRKCCLLILITKRRRESGRCMVAVDNIDKKGKKKVVYSLFIAREKEKVSRLSIMK